MYASYHSGSGYAKTGLAIGAHTVSQFFINLYNYDIDFNNIRLYWFAIGT